MICYKCGCRLSEKDFCTGCGVDVKLYKKIMYAANRYYNEGLEKARVRDLSGAVTNLRQCLKCNKNHIEARNLLGLVYFERGDVVAALCEWVISKNIQSQKNIADDYINMVQSNPGRLDAINQTIKKYNQALAYCQQDSLDLAIIQLKKVLSMNSKFLQAHQLLALLYINAEEWEKARKELEKCLKIDTNNTTTLRYMQEVELMMPAEEGKKKKDVIVYQSGNDTVIQPINHHETMGLSSLFNIVIGVAIGIAAAWFLILPARIQTAQNSINNELKTVSEQLDAKTVTINELTQQIEQLTADNSNLEQTVASAGSTSLQVNNDLIEAARMYVEQTGDNLAIAENLERIPQEYLDSEATEAFVSLYQKLREAIAASVSESYYDTGYAAFRNEEYETAIIYLQKAYDYDPTNGEALYNLASSYNKSGDTKHAVEVCNQVLEQFPDSEKAKKAQNMIREINGEE